MLSLRAWWTNGVAVAFMYCSMSVLAKVVARKSVVASSKTQETSIVHPKQAVTKYVYTSNWPRDTDSHEANTALYYLKDI